MRALAALLLCFLISAPALAVEIAVLKKECQAKKYSSCEEAGLSLLLDNKVDESYPFFKISCEKEKNCQGLSTYYEKKGKFAEARKLLKESCKTSARSCYDLSDFEKSHGTPKSAREALMTACEKKFNEKKCKEVGLKDKSEDTAEDKELKGLFCKGDACSDFEKYQSQIAETFLRMRKLNYSCQKNDGGSCSDLAVLLKAAEQTTPVKFQSDLPVFLTKLGIQGNSQDYFKKACDLKHQLACKELK